MALSFSLNLDGEADTKPPGSHGGHVPHAIGFRQTHTPTTQLNHHRLVLAALADRRRVGTAKAKGICDKRYPKLAEWGAAHYVFLWQR
jgi:hypothetical protein